MIKTIKWFTASTLCFCLCACEKSADNKEVEAQPAKASDVTLDQQQAMNQEQLAQANILFNTGDEALKEASNAMAILQLTITSFLAEPTQAHLNTAQTAWQDTVLAYRKFSYFRHIALTAPNIFPQLSRLDYQIANFPIQPGFLDTFGPYPYSGLVHDIGFELNTQSLRNQHGLTDASESVLGLHAIEFMLFNEGVQRDYNDFTSINTLDKSLQERGFKTPEETPKNRRRTLLALQVKALNDDIKELSNIWQTATPENTQALWQNLPALKAQEVGLAALESTLTQVLIEIGELNQKKEGANYNAISSSFITAKEPLKQRFITNALASTKIASSFLPGDHKATFEQHINQAIASAKTENSNIEEENVTEEKATENAYWRNAFSETKQAIDLINTIKQPL